MTENTPSTNAADQPNPKTEPERTQLAIQAQLLRVACQADDVRNLHVTAGTGDGPHGAPVTFACKPEPHPADIELDDMAQMLQTRHEAKTAAADGEKTMGDGTGNRKEGEGPVGPSAAHTDLAGALRELHRATATGAMRLSFLRLAEPMPQDPQAREAWAAAPNPQLTELRLRKHPGDGKHPGRLQLELHLPAAGEHGQADRIHHLTLEPGGERYADDQAYVDLAAAIIQAQDELKAPDGWHPGPSTIPYVRGVAVPDGHMQTAQRIQQLYDPNDRNGGPPPTTEQVH